MLKPPGPPKHSAPVAQPLDGTGGELLALQAIIPMIGAGSAGRGVEIDQSGTAADPYPAARIADDPIRHVRALAARQRHCAQLLPGGFSLRIQRVRDTGIRGDPDPAPAVQTQ